ncbi:MAG: DUF4129 domain-containing protein [Chloroflexi bacterium]|nr:MAG: DUF4129 domain-containing protein [Chloroflexota bacterium]MBL1194013.1 DUF4129 domain-containing protein [Chloroflexota bacterium]NOH11307.1 DUF4129 domain-containing protein [Chloroflexota bacterium]
MVPGNKTWFLALAAIALLALVILSASLPDLDLQPSQRFQLFPERSQFNDSPLDEFVSPDVRAFIIIAIYILGYVLFPLSIILFIFRPEMRQGFRRYLTLLLWMLTIYYLILNFSRRVNLDQLLAPNAGGEEVLGDPVVVAPNSPPEWLVYAVSFFILLVLTGLGVYIYMRFFRTTPLQEIAQDAQEALDDLYAGADIGDTIKRCYVDMSRTLNATRGIQRHEAMTPRQFERRLGALGLPNQEVQQLTRLFEQVRYGNKQPDPQQETQAIDCLSAIVLHAQTST